MEKSDHPSNVTRDRKGIVNGNEGVIFTDEFRKRALQII